jgi:hypothetical protein
MDMLNSIGGLVVGLLLGVYLAASYSDLTAKELHSVGIPLLGQHAAVTAAH